MFWKKIAESRAELFQGENNLAEIEVDGKLVCVVMHEEKLKACAAKCPHAGGKMASGYIDALGNIVCPLHRYKFSLENGRNVTGEGYFLKIYKVEEREEGVFIGIEEKKALFG
jgi:3-phenylpropionate/trans-cinnamate dioxygenase ferredoxin subunit